MWFVGASSDIKTVLINTAL